MKSKGIAAWAALLLGSVGAHRFYLFGWNDRWALAHPLPTLLALIGLRQVETLGTDAPALTWAFPLFGLMLAIGCLNAILIGLTPDDKWNARFNAGAPNDSRWGPVLAAVFGLLLGGAALMATIAFTAQRYFEITQ
jgi:TM2 domain